LSTWDLAEIGKLSKSFFLAKDSRPKLHTLGLKTYILKTLGGKIEIEILSTYNILWKICSCFSENGNILLHLLLDFITSLALLPSFGSQLLSHSIAALSSRRLAII